MQSDIITLSASVLEKAVGKIKPEKSTALKSSVVALYTADPQGKLRYSNLIGLLQLDIDRGLKSNLLRVYDLQTLALAFEIQIYYGLQNNLKIVNESIILIDYPRGSIAFLFRNKQQAQLMKSKIISRCPSIQEFQQIKHKNIQAARKKEEQNTLFGKLKKKMFGADQPQQHTQSQVISVKKSSSIQINLLDGSFNTENIPPEWQQMFDALKLSKEDLKDKDLMGVIFEDTILNQAKRQAEKDSNKDLQKKVQIAETQGKKQIQQYAQQVSRNSVLNLPLPPPPPPPLLTPPNNRISSYSKRANLMDEIRNHNIKLNHVNVNEAKGKSEMTLDISDMNKDERNDHIEKLRIKLQMRKKALNRRTDDSDDD